MGLITDISKLNIPTDKVNQELNDSFAAYYGTRYAFDECEKKCYGYFDGSCRPNPGPMGIGVVLFDWQTKREVWRYSKIIGNGTNNVAEMTAAIVAVNQAKQLGYSGIQLYGDSQLTVSSIAGRFKMNAPHLKILKEKFNVVRSGIVVKSNWVPREKNEIADILSAEGHEKK